jgi:hypothetical protein
MEGDNTPEDSASLEAADLFGDRVAVDGGEHTAAAADTDARAGAGIII